jgi:hypothetical protein
MPLTHETTLGKRRARRLRNRMVLVISRGVRSPNLCVVVGVFVHVWCGVRTCMNRYYSCTQMRGSKKKHAAASLCLARRERAPPLGRDRDGVTLPAVPCDAATSPLSGGLPDASPSALTLFLELGAALPRVWRPSAGAAACAPLLSVGARGGGHAPLFSASARPLPPSFLPARVAAATAPDLRRGFGLPAGTRRVRLLRVGPVRNGTMGPGLGCRHSPWAGTTRHDGDQCRACPARDLAGHPRPGPGRAGWPEWTSIVGCLVLSRRVGTSSRVGRGTARSWLGRGRVTRAMPRVRHHQPYKNPGTSAWNGKAGGTEEQQPTERTVAGSIDRNDRLSDRATSSRRAACERDRVRACRPLSSSYAATDGPVQPAKSTHPCVMLVRCRHRS